MSFNRWPLSCLDAYPLRITMPVTGQEYIPNTIGFVIVKQIGADFRKDNAQKETARKR